MIRLLLFCLALATGLYGALTNSAVALLAAALLMFVASGRFPWWRSQSVGEPGRDRQPPLERYGWWLIVLGAVGAALVAAHQTYLDPGNRSSAYFWTVGLFLMVVAAYLHDAQPSAPNATEQPETPSTTSPRKSFHFTKLDWLLMLFSFGVALALRLYRLSDFLPTMHGDEGEMGELARLVLSGPSSPYLMPLPLFATGFLNHPTLFHYLQALALLCFGNSLTGLRILSAIFGALCAPTLYAVGKVGWGRVAGLTAAWLLAVSHLHIHYSRIALNNIQSVWFTILFFLVLFIGVAQTQRPLGRPRQPAEQPLLPYVSLGLVIGLSQYFYYGSRLIPVLAVVLMGILLVQRRLTLTQLAVAVLATFVAYAPLALLYSQDLSAFLNRTQGVSVFNPEGLTRILGPQASWPRDIPQLLWSQVKDNIGFLIATGDRSAFYLADLPGFDRLTVVLFWLGLGVVLARLRHFPEMALIAWFGLGFLLAGVVTNDSPNGPRLIVVVSSVYLIAGVLGERVYHMSQRIWPSAHRWLAGFAFVLLAIGTLQMNYYTYFVTYARFAPNNMPITMAHMMAAEQDNYRFYLFGAPLFYADYSVLRFIALGSERYNVMTAEEIPRPTDKGVIAIALPDRLARLHEVAERWPGGEYREVVDQVGRLLYGVYRLPGPTPSVETTEVTPQGDTTSGAQVVSPLTIPTPVP